MEVVAVEPETAAADRPEADAIDTAARSEGGTGGAGQPDVPIDEPPVSDGPQTETTTSDPDAGAGGDGPPSESPPDMPSADQADGVLEPDADAATSLRGPGDDTAPPDGCPGPECLKLVAPDHLKLWLRGDELTSQRCEPTGNANRLSEWRDLSGSAHHARVPVGKNGPVCGPAAALINGRQTVRFPRSAGLAAEEHLEVDLGFLIGRAFTIVTVERRVGGDLTGSYFLGAQLPAPTQIDCLEDNANGGQGLLLGYQRPQVLVGGSWGNPCGAFGFPPAAGTEANVTVLTFEPDSAPSVEGRFTIRQDGQELGTERGAALARVIGFFIGRGYALAPDLPDSRYRGDLAEIAIYDQALSAGARAAVESQLRQTWGTKPP